MERRISRGGGACHEWNTEWIRADRLDRGRKRARREKVDRRRHRGVEVTSQPFERVRTCEIYWGPLKRAGRPATFKLVTPTREDRLNIHLSRPGKNPCPRGREERYSPPPPLFPSAHSTSYISCVRGLLAITLGAATNGGYTPLPRFNSPPTCTREYTGCLRKRIQEFDGLYCLSLENRYFFSDCFVNKISLSTSIAKFAIFSLRP